MALRKETTHLIIHCSATKPSMDWGVTEIDRMHRAQGYFQIGYHYVIRRAGRLEMGRQRTAIGAHCRDGGMNLVSLGVCLIGGVSEHPKKHIPGNPWNGSDAEDNFTDDQHLTLFSLIKDIREEFPNIEVIGHRDVPGVRKACPSFDVSEWLAQHFPDEYPTP